jgi:hypothetical protein
MAEQIGIAIVSYSKLLLGAFKILNSVHRYSLMEKHYMNRTDIQVCEAENSS